MGELFFHTGLAGRMFNAVEQLMGRVPARLSYVTVAGGTAFATLSGSSMGSTRAPRHPNGPGDDEARLQEGHVHRTDPRDGRARHADTAVRARRAARHAGRDRHREAPGRRRRARPAAGRVLRDPHLRPRDPRPGRRTVLRARVRAPEPAHPRVPARCPADGLDHRVRHRSHHGRGGDPVRGRGLRVRRGDPARGGVPVRCAARPRRFPGRPRLRSASLPSRWGSPCGARAG